MNIFSITYLVNVFLQIKSGYETIDLKLEKNNFYIPIKLGNSYDKDYFLLSTMTPINFFPSSKCSKCKYYKIDEKDFNKYKFIQADVSLLYFYLNFTGDLYKTNITLGSKMNTVEFIAFDDISDLDEYNGKGRYSLSFFNYFFNTTNKTFSIYLSSDSGQLYLGGYDSDKIENKNEIVIFNISKTNNSLPNIFNDFWFINFDYLFINSRKLEKLDFKLTLDLSTNYFHIPKDFFFFYSHLIFPVEGKCQVQPEGHFVCFCNERYNERFSSFKFMNENNETIEIKPEDYIFFDNSGADNYCYVYLMLNYDNDLFIAGKYVMNKYYTIFDIDNEQLKIYPIKKKNDEFSKERNIIISLVLLLVGIFLFLCCYLIYRKYFYNNQREEEYNIDEDNLFQGNNFNQINENLEQISGNNIHFQNEVGIVDRFVDNLNEEQNKEDNKSNEDEEKIDNEENEENNINNIDEDDDDNEIIFGGRESNIIN